jgi:putative transposase
VKGLCQLSGISRSAFYRKRKHPLSQRKQENLRLVEVMKEIHAGDKKSYGSPNMHQDLLSLGYFCGHNRVARLMRENGITSIVTLRFRSLTKAGKRAPVADNLLNQCFEVAEPNRVWASDITYIPTQEGFLYLAVVLDLYSRRVVGWGMSGRLGAELVKDALRQALGKREVREGLMHHSDRDGLYSSSSYQGLLSDNAMVCSMSRKGNCYDNACVESFFGSLKNEMVAFERFKSREEAALRIYEWIEIYYNRVRRHSTLGYVSPIEYERKNAYANKCVLTIG